MVVQHDADDGGLGVVGIQPLEKRENSRLRFDFGDDFTVVQVQSGQDGQCAVAHVFVVAPNSKVLTRHRR